VVVERFGNGVPSRFSVFVSLMRERERERERERDVKLEARNEKC
jgi:hypothetical protein